MSHKKKNVQAEFERRDDRTKTFSSIPEEDNDIKINNRKFEDDVREHFSKTHQTEVAEKLRALVDDVYDEAEDNAPIASAPVKQSEAHSKKHAKNEAERTKVKDKIDEQLDICFAEDKAASTQKSKKKKDDKATDTAPKVDVEYEYTDASQNLEILGRLRNETSSAFKSLIVLFVLSVISVCIDIFPLLGFKAMKFLQPGKYSSVFALISLQMLCFCVMLCLDSLKKGAINLFKGKSTPQSAALLTVLIVAVHEIVTSVLCAGASFAMVFCSVGSVSLFLLKICEYFKCRATLMSFQVISLKDTKFVASKCKEGCKEAQVFSELIDENSEILQIDKCSFIEGFFKNTAERSKNDRSIPLMSALSFVVGAVLFAVAFVLKKDFYLAFSMFIASFAALSPFGIYIANSFPLFNASKRAFKQRSAIVGETACEKFSSAAVMSFDDTLVFPPKNVKVTSMKTYGNYKIDSVIILMAKIFKSVGGPLSLAFENSVSTSDISGNVILTNVSPDGLSVGVDGQEYILGTKSFMSANGLDTPADSYDVSYSDNKGSVLYLAEKNSLAAKFYIKYNINSQFESLLSALYKEGICAGIRSVDPCINNELIEKNMAASKCPISVVKELTNNTAASSALPRQDASIISASSQSSFLRVFVIAGKLKQLFGANYVIKVIGFAITLLCLFVFAFTGNFAKITAALALLFQFIWLVPILLVSRFYK